MTAGKLVVDGGSFHLNKYVLQQAQRRQVVIMEKQEETRKKDELKYFIDCYKAEEALKHNVKTWKKTRDIRD